MKIRSRKMAKVWKEALYLARYYRAGAWERAASGGSTGDLGYKFSVRCMEEDAERLGIPSWIFYRAALSGERMYHKGMPYPDPYK
ncbi:hypothetical protein D6783_02405 [Candidatus Woesearchaeota archaeon]|nr:MAG: hypothetical protein D6783_02405 [Candidatus Woesearchaeota archaeon]